MGDVTQVLKDLGISIRNPDDSLKTLRDILEELNKLWNDLSKETKELICKEVLNNEK